MMIVHSLCFTFHFAVVERVYLLWASEIVALYVVGLEDGHGHFEVITARKWHTGVPVLL
jgi:hypothetical protein